MHDFSGLSLSSSLKFSQFSQWRHLLSRSRKQELNLPVQDQEAWTQPPGPRMILSSVLLVAPPIIPSCSSCMLLSPLWGAVIILTPMGFNFNFYFYF